MLSAVPTRFVAQTLKNGLLLLPHRESAYGVPFLQRAFAQIPSCCLSSYIVLCHGLHSGYFAGRDWTELTVVSFHTASHKPWPLV